MQDSFFEGVTLTFLAFYTNLCDFQFIYVDKMRQPVNKFTTR